MRCRQGAKQQRSRDCHNMLHNSESLHFRSPRRWDEKHDSNPTVGSWGGGVKLHPESAALRRNPLVTRGSPLPLILSFSAITESAVRRISKREPSALCAPLDELLGSEDPDRRSGEKERRKRAGGRGRAPDQHRDLDVDEKKLLTTATTSYPVTALEFLARWVGPVPERYEVL